LLDYEPQTTQFRRELIHVAEKPKPLLAESGIRAPAGLGPLRQGIALLTVILWPQMVVLFAQTSSGLEPRLESGKEIYQAACAACHGSDGRGASRTSVGFEEPLPDFTDCSFATREPDADWSAVIHDGGPVRAFSEMMPSFREALTSEQIDKVIQHIRGFCRSRDWPRGELNLPRALVTEKAFPEDEAVITTAINARGTPAVSQQIVYERRFGAVNQIELSVPFGFARKNVGDWAGGVGDLALGYKRTLFHSLRTGSIFSLGGEAVLPTGDKARGFGNGVTVFESFASYGQILPSDSFLQFQAGVEVPTHGDDASKAAFWRTTAGWSFSQGGGFGRTWSPMIELLADRDFQSGAKTNWDLLPQVQVTLSQRQHMMANFGVRIPANNTAGRPIQLVFYLLWDWFDGGLRDGW
jgi:mono/diheme cytochrome c family protein